MKCIQLNRSAALMFPFVLLSLIVSTACDVRVFDSDDKVDNTNFFATETFSFEIAVKNQTRLNLDAIDGRVYVSGVRNAATARIWGERRIESESVADAKAHLEELEARVTDRQDEISVQTLQPNNTHGRNYTVTYHLRIPNTWKLSVAQVNGDLMIDSLYNDVSVKIANGSMLLTGIFGSFIAELSNGQLTGDLHLPLQGTCQITTVNGWIRLIIPKSTSAEFSASVTNGNIGLSNLSLQDVLSTPKSLRGKLGDGQGTISLTTINGNIGVSGF